MEDYFKSFYKATNQDNGLQEKKETHKSMQNLKKYIPFYQKWKEPAVRNQQNS